MIYRSWEIEHNGLKLVSLGHFCPFILLKPKKKKKIKTLKQWKKLRLEISFHSHVPKIIIIWCKVCEIGSEADEFLSFWVIVLPFYPPKFTFLHEKSKFWKIEKKTPKNNSRGIILHISTINDNHIMYGSWNMDILGHFLLFYPANNPKIQNFEKLKMPGDITILHMCTINDNHMMYGSWDMEHDRQIFSFQTIFFFFASLPH